MQDTPIARGALAPSPTRAAARKRLGGAMRELVGALAELTGANVGEETAARIEKFWAEHLLGGHTFDLAASLGDGIAHEDATPVALEGIGVHLVCPHHLTVAFGSASLAYLPGGKIAGLGGLATMVEHSCARLVLQEDAAKQAAQAVVAGLGAKAAVVCIDARHPCHGVLVPRSHEARLTTWGSAGDPAGIAALRQLVATPK